MLHGRSIYSGFMVGLIIRPMKRSFKSNYDCHTSNKAFHLLSVQFIPLRGNRTLWKSGLGQTKQVVEKASISWNTGLWKLILIREFVFSGRNRSRYPTKRFDGLTEKNTKWETPQKSNLAGKWFHQIGFPRIMKYSDGFLDCLSLAVLVGLHLKHLISSRNVSSPAIH